LSNISQDKTGEVGDGETSQPSQETATSEDTPAPKDTLTEEQLAQKIQESYDRGYQEGLEKMKQDMTLQQEQSNTILNDSSKRITTLLEEKIALIAPSFDIEKQFAQVAADAISRIAKKLYLVLPTNFAELITKGLIAKLSGFYKEGNITLLIHPTKYNFCIELLKLDGIQDKLKDRIQVVQDDSIGSNDCRVEYGNTKLEYNQEQLVSEIDEIIESLRQN
jgi:flagellar biosynthesis/type III secretory pathway protein FliH